MPSNQPTEEPIQPESPLTWSDIQGVIDRLGIRPVKHKTKRRSPAASRIHAAYDSWLTRQSLSGTDYVMSLNDLYRELKYFRGDGSAVESRRDQCVAARTARQTIVVALLDSRRGFVLVERPLQKYRRRAA